MKSPSSIPALARHVAVALVAFGLTASCTNDEIIGSQDDDVDGGGLAPTPDAADKPETGRPDSGGPGPRCGDGRLDPGEECDDGNAIAGDGCTLGCKTETAPVLPEDACPGAELVLTASGATRSGSVTGNNAALNPNYETTCGGGNGKDAIYKITSDRPGRAVAKLSAEFAGLLSLRGSCTPSSNETTCKAAATVGEDVELVFPLAAQQTIFVVVDALAGGTGNYTLSVDVTDSACGDGVAQLPEQCDDSNAVNGDGCNDECQFEDPPSEPGTCPGASYTIVGNPAAPVTVSFAGDLSLAGSVSSARNCRPSASPPWSSSGNDQVYAFTPTISGALKTTLHASYARPSLHVREECYSSDSELECTTSLLAEPISLTIPVVANQTYFVFADVGSAAGGPYTLEATLLPPSCGDAVVQTGEQCDDGALADGDGCSATCQLEPSLPGLDTCPGATVAFQTGPADTRTFTTRDDTSRLTADVWTRCGASQSPAATAAQRSIKDAVYSFVAPYDGYLEAALSADFIAALDLRTVCDPLTNAPPGSGTTPGGGSLLCDDTQADGFSTTTLRSPVTAGQTYFLVVKGAITLTNTNSGAYELKLDLKPAVCGNGLIEGIEACDDGPWPVGYNHESGCTASCTVAPNAATGATCVTADPIALAETGDGTGIYEGHAVGGNWNRPQFTANQPGCSTAGNQQFFTVTPTITGVLVARTTGTFPITLGGKPSCVNVGSNTSTLGTSCFGNVAEQTLAFAVTAGTPLILTVDGRSVNTAGKGRFELDVSVGPPACGDTIRVGTEECDDGNTVGGDGCSATCTLEPLANSDQCPGAPLALTAQEDGSYAASLVLSTNGAQANYAGTKDGCGGSGRDRVLQFVAPISGALTARIEAQGWTPVLYARETCVDPLSELDCAPIPTTASPVRLLEEPVVAGQPVFLFADGNAGQAGPANLQIVITP